MKKLWKDWEYLKAILPKAPRKMNGVTQNNVSPRFIYDD